MSKEFLLHKKIENKELLLQHVSAILDIYTVILSKIKRVERKAKKEKIAKSDDIPELDKKSILIQYLS